MQISDDQSPLEVSAEQLRHDVNGVLDYLTQHLQTLDSQPAWDLADADASNVSARETIPIEPGQFDAIIEDLFSNRMTPSYNPSCGGYLAYVPGGGLPHAAVADLISGILNKFVTLWQVAPGFANIEADVIDWFSGIVGFPNTAGGYLTTGGSMANWSAIVTARRVQLGDQFLDGVIYTTEQSHHSVMKAAVLAGFPEANVRLVPTTNLVIDVPALEAQIQSDQEHGARPFLVVANAGTTNTGAVDDLSAIARVCNEHSLWLHTDAAYGGVFMLTKRGKNRLSGIELSDSITLDPHKGLFLPYGTGCLLVKNACHLEQAHKVAAKYLPPFQEESDRIDFSGISPELSRDFRGLRVWLPFKLFGTQTFAAYLDEKLDLCQYAFKQIQALEQIEILAEPTLSTFAFRYRPRDCSPGDELNSLNQRFLTEVNRTKRFLLSATYLGDEFTIRICVLSFRTHQRHIDDCVEEVRRVTRLFNDGSLTN